MKKALLGTFVTLLVMAALVSCDDVVGGSGGKYLPDGKMVKVNIVIDEGRSMIDNAGLRSAANYMEVFFKGPDAATTIHHAKGIRALGLSIELPVGEYLQADTLLLLGRNSDKMLIATGRLSNPAGETIATGNSTIEFTVTSITANLLSGIGTSIVLGGAGTTGGLYEGFSCFQVSSGGTATGTLTFGGFAANGVNVIMAAGSTLNFFLVDAATNATLPAFSGAITTPVNGTAVGAGAIGFSFTALSTVDVAYKGYFDIKVVGFATSGITGAETWSLRGGTVRGVADLVAGEGNEGFVVVTYNPAAPGSVTIDIGGGW
jgi:hypothetical protein